MAITCWVFGCNHNNMRDPCSFFRFPSSKQIRSKWITLMRRQGKPGPGARVCSCHFKDGNKENIPSIFPHTEGKPLKEHHLTPERLEAIDHETLMSKDELETSGGEVTMLQEDRPSTLACEPGPSTSSSDLIKSSVAEYEAEICLLKQEIEKKDEIIKMLMTHHMTTEDIYKDDKLMLLYTGLPTCHIFESLYELIEDVEINYYLLWNVQKINRKDQLLMCLMKLKQNFSYADLAHRFQVSEATVTNVVVTFIHVLYDVLFKTLMKDISSRKKNQSCLPDCVSTFTNCRIIIDVTEVFCAVPKMLLKNQRLTHSSYKHQNTLKGLVGVAPNGVVTFISSLYPGSTSDEAIVKHCGILNQMVPGDLILADTRLLITDLLPNGVSLNIPPFLDTPEPTPEQSSRIESIARTRKHVERAICRMKGYKILSPIPEKLFEYSSIIFKTVGALTNLQYPLIEDVSQFC